MISTKKGKYMSQGITTICIGQEPEQSERATFGQIVGTSQVKKRLKCEFKAETDFTMSRRLLDLEAAATYLGVSPWTVRDLEAAGVLMRVRVPLPGGRELRKLLFDKADLDRLIEVWKDSAA
jgi:hypothetical protein